MQNYKMSLPKRKAKPARTAQKKYGKQDDGGYETPYSTIIFYSTEDFGQSCIAEAAISADIIAYNDDFSQIDWAELYKLPEYLAPRVLLFDAFVEPIPRCTFEGFASREFPEVWVITDREECYPNVRCVRLEDISQCYKSPDASHYECIQRLIHYIRPVKLEPTPLDMFLGLRFGATTEHAARRFAAVAKSGMRIADNITRCEMRGVAIRDLRHYFGKSFADSAWICGKFLVAILPQNLFGDSGIDKELAEHMTAREITDYGIIISPRGGKYHVISWPILARGVINHGEILTKEELRDLIGGDFAP